MILFTFIGFYLLINKAIIISIITIIIIEHCTQRDNELAAVDSRGGVGGEVVVMERM